MQKFIIFLYCLATLLLASCGQLKTIIPFLEPTQTPVPASTLIMQLNHWDAEDMNVLLCSNLYSNRVAAGETGGFYLSRIKNLNALGIYVRWDCGIQTFERTTEENQKSLCDCK